MKDEKVNFVDVKHNKNDEWIILFANCLIFENKIDENDWIV
jgi:hypothetical protein